MLMSTKAVNTTNTILKFSDTQDGTFEKLLDITNYPDLGSTPAKLDSTDLTATKFKTSILGLQEVPDLAFEANYNFEAYKTIVGMEGEEYYFRLEFDDGKDGVFQWKGDISIYANGGGVDEVRKMTVTLSARPQ